MATHLEQAKARIARVREELIAEQKQAKRQRKRQSKAKIIIRHKYTSAPSRWSDDHVPTENETLILEVIDSLRFHIPEVRYMDCTSVNWEKLRKP